MHGLADGRFVVEHAQATRPLYLQISADSLDALIINLLILSIDNLFVMGSQRLLAASYANVIDGILVKSCRAGNIAALKGCRHMGKLCSGICLFCRRRLFCLHLFFFVVILDAQKGSVQRGRAGFHCLHHIVNPSAAHDFAGEAFVDLL